MEINDKVLNYVKEKYKAKFGSLDNFDKDYRLYLEMPIFKANQNIHEVLTDYSKKDLADVEARYVKQDNLRYGVHFIMRALATYYMTEVFEAMKIDLEDPNTRENALLKSTPGRVVKMWTGADSEDADELGSGRWVKEPYISCFPNTDDNHSIIIKEVDVVSCCSHHFLPFSTFDGGKAIIAYKPKEFVLGISKLQRYTNWVARRFWLQEDLTKHLGEAIKRIAKTDDVYIKLEGLVHGCEKFRGAKACNGNLTTEFKSGWFKEVDYTM